MTQRDKKGLRITTSCSYEDMLFSPIEVTPDLSIFSPQREPSLIKRYEEMSLEFKKEGVLYQRQCLIKGLSREWQVQTKWTFDESYKLLTDVTTALLLNEIEIVFWSLLLKSKIDTMTEKHYLAYFTGYLTKWNLNADILPFEVYMNTIIQNFRLNFYNWQLVSDFSCEIPLKEINERYNQLIRIAKKSHKDYEMMVGTLMQIPRRRASVVSESIMSERSFDDMNFLNSLEGYEKDLLEEARQSPIDKF